MANKTNHVNTINTSFEDAKNFAQALNLKTKQQWMNYHKVNKPSGIPIEPSQKYKNSGWTSWGDFLGTGNLSDQNLNKQFYSYHKAKEYLKQFNFTDEQQFYDWCKTENRPQFIPASPRKTYLNKGWVSMNDFLSNNQTFSTLLRSQNFLSYEECQQFALSKKFLSDYDWKKWAKTKEKPHNIPFNPTQVYANKGWTCWADFLGYKRKQSYGEKIIASFLEQNNISYQWQKSFSDCKYRNKLPFDFALYNNDTLICLIEFHGKQHYTEDLHFNAEKIQIRDAIKKKYCQNKNINLFEISYKDIDKTESVLCDLLKPFWNNLDVYERKNIRNLDKFYSYEEAKNFLKLFKITTYIEFNRWHSANSFSFIPSAPSTVYKDCGWISWADFLETKNINCKTKKELFLSYEDCKLWFKENNIKNGEDWNIKRKNKPDYIPAHPEIIYKENGWNGWKEFLS